MQRRRAMTWTSVGRSAQAVVAHGLLFCFTLFLALKIDRRTSYSWWIIFAPLWLFHAVVARGRFSLPAPSLPHGRHWAPCHAIVATPLLVAFELLLCIYLQSISVGNHPSVNLKIVFLPLLAFEIIILVDNFSCRSSRDVAYCIWPSRRSTCSLLRQKPKSHLDSKRPARSNYLFWLSKSRPNRPYVSSFNPGGFGWSNLIWVETSALPMGSHNRNYYSVLLIFVRVSGHFDGISDSKIVVKV